MIGLFKESPDLLQASCKEDLGRDRVLCLMPALEKYISPNDAKVAGDEMCGAEKRDVFSQAKLHMSSVSIVFLADHVVLDQVEDIELL